MYNKESNMKKPISFRLEEDLLIRLNEKAKKQNRSLTNLVETVLKRFLDEKE